MKFVTWKDEWYDDGNKLRNITKTIECESLNKLIFKLIKDTDFTKEDLLVSTDNAQIRIPETEFNCLSQEVKDALRKESVPPTQDGYMPNDRWVKENYWANCKAYIFNFNSYVIRRGLEWGYEGIEGEKRLINLLLYEHPFIAEFIECRERRWGESDEDKKIKKWQVT